jgi:hypothetical protein
MPACYLKVEENRVVAQNQDQRRSDRLMCSELVEIAFQDQTGRWICENGVIEDVGTNGIGVSLNLPVGIGRIVTVSNPRFRSQATVKRCEFEVSGGFEWNHSDWEPEHLLRFPKE